MRRLAAELGFVVMLRDSLRVGGVVVLVLMLDPCALAPALPADGTPECRLRGDIAPTWCSDRRWSTIGGLFLMMSNRLTKRRSVVEGDGDTDGPADEDEFVGDMNESTFVSIAEAIAADMLARRVLELVPSLFIGRCCGMLFDATIICDIIEPIWLIGPPTPTPTPMPPPVLPVLPVLPALPLPILLVLAARCSIAR